MTLFLVVGPPAAGKSTWVKDHAQPGDITVDFDALANTLSPYDSGEHDHSESVKVVAKAARRAAIDTAVQMRDYTDVYIIHSTPSERMLTKYCSLGARVIIVDPGRDTVEKRAEVERPRRMLAVIAKWYDEIDHYVHRFEKPSVEPTWVVPSW